VEIKTKAGADMKCLTFNEANAYLSAIGMMLGNWNQVTDIDSSVHKARSYEKGRAPAGSLELLNFAQHMAGWVPNGDWKIIQLDNSTNLDPIQASLFGGLMYGPRDIRDLDFEEQRTFLFQLGQSDDSSTELLIAHLVYLLLLFECHGYVVSSGSSSGEVLSLQDGFVYLSSRDKEAAGAKSILQASEKNPLMAPAWVQKIIEDYQ